MFAQLTPITFIIRLGVDIWFFQIFAKYFAIFGFLAATLTTKKHNTSIQLAWSSMGTMLSAVWIVLSSFWPENSKPVITLISLAMCSYCTGALYHFSSTRSKSFAVFSTLVSLMTLIILIETVTMTLPINIQLDRFVIATIEVSIGFSLYMIIIKAPQKLYNLINIATKTSVIVSAVLMGTVSTALFVNETLLPITNITFFILGITCTVNICMIIVEHHRSYLKHADKVFNTSVIILLFLIWPLVLFIQALFLNFPIQPH